MENKKAISYDEIVSKVKTFNGIILVDDVITHSLAEDLISHIDDPSNITKEEKWGNNYNVICDYIHILNIHDHIIRERFDSELYKGIGKIIQHNYDKYDIVSKSDTGYCLRRHNGATRLHKDGVTGYGDSPKQISSKAIRNMSIIISLNDNYEGGEFHFPFQNKKIKLKKCQAVVFPPYWTHPHGVSATKNGTIRYSINTWLYE